MTKFEKSKLVGSEYVTYEGKFVARFKHVRSNKSGFISFLVKNFSVEEYFAAMERGNAPATILETKGYVPAHIKRWLKDGTLKEWKGVEHAIAQFK
jgi:hypothetical protein